MSKYEYKVIELKIKEKLLKSSAPEVTEILSKEGEEGWRFVQFYYPFARQQLYEVVNAIFERELDE